MQAFRALELDLRKAIMNGEFELYYQPIINGEDSGVNRRRIRALTHSR